MSAKNTEPADGPTLKSYAGSSRASMPWIRSARSFWPLVKPVSLLAAPDGRTTDGRHHSPPDVGQQSGTLSNRIDWYVTDSRLPLQEARSSSFEITTTEIGNMKIILSLVSLCLVTARRGAKRLGPRQTLGRSQREGVGSRVADRWLAEHRDRRGGEGDAGRRHWPGPPDGATVARVAKRLAPDNKLYLTTTHFHPEHAGGVTGFPDGTILIRPKVQQEEMDKHGVEMIHRFESMNARWKEFLADAKLPLRTGPSTRNWNWISGAA